MNPIDQAFLNAYAKKKNGPKSPPVLDNVQSTPLNDPQAKRVLRADRPDTSAQVPPPHSPTEPIPTPSLASSLRSPSVVVASIAEPSEPAPAQPIVHLRIDRAAQPATPAAVPKSIRPLSLTDPTPGTNGDESTRRRTLTSYLQQSRRGLNLTAPAQSPPTPASSYLASTSHGAATVEHHGAAHRTAASAPSIAQSPLHRAEPSLQTPSVTPRLLPIEQDATSAQIRVAEKAPSISSRWSHANVNQAPSLRIDPQHSVHPPVTRSAETLPWQSTSVERSIKAVAGSVPLVAKTINPNAASAPSLPLVEPSNTQVHQLPPIERPLNEFGVPAPHYDRFIARPDQPATQESQTYPSTSPPVKDLEPSQVKSHRAPQPVVAESLDRVVLPIQAVWEVDTFLWPTTVDSLLETQAQAFHEIGLHFQRVHSKGLRVLAVTGGERGVGRSTVAMCLAKTIAQTGLRVALMDGDYECPSLVDQLNLAVDHGWQDCLTKNVPLDEVVVQSIQDNVAFLPLTDSIAPSLLGAYAPRINKLMKRLAQAYDFVVVDANRINQKTPRLLGTGSEAVLDAALVILDAELSLRQRVDSAIELIREQGIQSVGLAENFHAGIGG